METKMILRLKRFSYSSTETEGVLTLNDGTKFATIEQPWMPNSNGARGGEPFNSCVPDGMYQLAPWESPTKGEVYILSAPELGVHKLPEHHGAWHGRNLCLIHVANFAHEVEGCIAIGMLRYPMKKRGTDIAPYQAVSDSRAAMRLLREKLGRDKTHILSIESVTGASDV